MTGEAVFLQAGFYGVTNFADALSIPGHTSTNARTDVASLKAFGAPSVIKII